MPPRRRLNVVEDHKLLPSVRQTLSELKSEPEDTGMRKLAEQYASAIDDAQAIAVDARALVEQTKRGEIELPRRMLNALEKYSDATNVLGELGPKLQSALESLGASPRSRAAITGKGVQKNDQPSKSAGAAEDRRARAAQRRASAREHGS